MAIAHHADWRVCVCVCEREELRERVCATAHCVCLREGGFVM